MIEVKGITKKYSDRYVLNDVSLNVKEGEFFIITGRSGSGKSTLMKIMSGLLSPNDGEVKTDGRSIMNLSEKDRCAFRNHLIGYVFQTFGLEGNYTAFENVEVPLVIAGIKKKERRERILDIAEKVGIVSILNKPARVLSGGEKQRVAIARAIVNSPKYLFADEPCGNLDTENTAMILHLLKGFSEKGITIIMVTHDQSQLSLATHSIELTDGKIENEMFFDREIF